MIAVLYPSPHLGSTPAARNLIECLAREGHELEVVCYSSAHDPLPPMPPGVRIHALPGMGGLRAFEKFLARVPLANAKAILAIDRGGLIAAARWRRRNHKPLPLVYLSTEIFVPPVFTGWRHRAANWLERRAAREAALVISLSRERARLHSTLFAVPESKARWFPNSPSGPACPEPRTDVLRNHLNIEPGRPIILYAGSLSAPNRVEELLADAAANWPAEWVLVLHSRTPLDNSGRARVEAWRRRAACSIRLTDEPVSAVKLAEYCRGADAGIALYREDGPAFQTVGTASGKIAQYLQAGLPVVATPLDSLVSLFEEGGGSCARVERGELRGAIEAALARGMAGRTAAARCFERHFRFDKAYDALAAELHEALGRG
ncbi:glycosyltransferase family 4 protein [Candidatus Poribacteria bacterium]|nr:glycosyltransferase family 4 protein [Candidatus Poribacteria bacterium]